MTSSPLSRPRIWLALLLALGGLLRLLDLTDPPLDFHPTRQLRNSIIARGIYYELLPNADASTRDLAASIARVPARYEPPVTETLVALTYLVVGGESTMVPRVYGTIFWLLAGLCLYNLARRITDSSIAALLSLAYFLVLPFAVQASRSFQPDPLMTSAAFIGIYFLYLWSESITNYQLPISQSTSWKLAIIASILIGFATFVKIFIGFIVGGAAVAIVLFTLGWKFWRSPQVWTMAAIMVIPAFLFYFTGDRGNSTEYITNWSLDMLKLITSGDFYTKWLAFLGSLFGQTFIFLSIAGTLLAAPRGRALLIGLWAGYLLYGLSVPFQMYTHSYYHIQLTPIIALGLSPLAEAIVTKALSGAPRSLGSAVEGRLLGETRIWQAALTGLVVLVIGFQAYVARSVLLAEDFRHEPAYWQAVGEAVPADADVIALAQDYGYRLMYYGWRRVGLWPLASGLAELRGNKLNAEKIFAESAADKDYFLVTLFSQLDKQPDLKKILDQYPIAAQGDGFVLYDLR
ncbi:MAG: glycosyltransferase family 39 protein [Chloroflexi bacterium]|nr:glycosyltransferase family 39 protein [Chloroflexota bacterium]